MNLFQATVSALGYTLLNERVALAAQDDDDDFPHNRTVRFLLDQHGRMPDYLRSPFAAVTVAFGLSSLLRHGRMFHRLGPEARRRHVEAWRSASLGPCRDLVRFYESFTLFHWHANRHGRREALAPTVAAQEAVR